MKLGPLLKWGILIKGVSCDRVAEEVWSGTFLQQIREEESSCKNLMNSPKMKQVAWNESSLILTTQK
jgi:hypothetical protein